MHHLIRTTKRLIAADGRTVNQIADTAGLSVGNISRWKHVTPLVQNLEAVLEVLGYELVIEKAASAITADRKPARGTRTESTATVGPVRHQHHVAVHVGADHFADTG